MEKVKENRIGIIINYGTEIRPFFESGLPQILKGKTDFLYIIRDNKLLNKKTLSFLGKQIIYDKSKIENRYSRIYYKMFYKFCELFYRHRKSKLRSSGLGTFHFTTGMNTSKKRLDLIFGSKIVNYFFRKIYSYLSKKFYHSEYIENIFRQNQITGILYYGNNLKETSFFSQTAKNLNLKLYHYVGNWKDLFIDNFISVVPEKIFVWSNKMKLDIISFNKNISLNCVEIVGNLYLDGLKSITSLYKKEYYWKKYGIKEHAKLIIWPLASSQLFPKELILVKLIDQFIEEELPNNKPVVLIRNNPFGPTQNELDSYKGLKNIVFASNYWSVSIEDDFLFQSHEGEREWADLLRYCDGVMSIPSTVALESMLFNKYFINILFDESLSVNDKFASFLKVPFYGDFLLNNEKILICNEFIQFKEKFRMILEKQQDIVEHNNMRFVGGKKIERLGLTLSEL